MTKTEVPDGLRLSLYNRQAILKHRLSDAEYKSSLLHFLRAGSLGVLDEAATRASTAGSTPPQKPKTGSGSNLALAASLIVVLGAVSWWFAASRDDSGAVSKVGSIAAMPFTSIGLTEESEWLALGIPGELTEMLSCVPRLRVASRESAFAMHEAGQEPRSIGEALAVDGVLTGSLERNGDGLKVRMELIRSADGEVLWREAFSGSVVDAGALQTELSGQIFKHFGAHLSEYNVVRPRTEEAYGAHLKRLAKSLTGNTEEELKWAELTIALEPDFVMGYLNVVFPYLYPAITGPDGPWFGKVRQALDKAAALGLSESRTYIAHEGLYKWVAARNA
jgi:TolB-like protein